jgi:predicted dehydrogenase
VNKRVIDSRIFSRGRAFTYLEDHDRFLTGSEEPQFSYGFIGCGMMGLEHIRNALLVGRAGIGGIFDPAEKSVRHAMQTIEKIAEGAKPRIYESLKDACADPDTDALVIATPNFTHLDVMRVAVRSDKAIFLEKPIATSVDDAFEVCRLAAAHSRPVRLGLQYRYKAIYAEAIREVFAHESVGRVHSINMLEHRFPFLDKVGQWNKFNAYTGGSLIEKCCHYFDLMNLFADGRPKQVFAIGNQAVNFRDFAYDNKKADGLDQAQVTVDYDNGVIGAFSLCMFVPGAREEMIVCGDTGRLRVSEQSLLGQEHENHLEVWSGENGASRTSVPTYPPYIASAGHHGSTFFEHVAFANDLLSGACHGPSLADGFWSVVVGAAAQASIERGDAVAVADLLPEGFDPDRLEQHETRSSA